VAAAPYYSQPDAPDGHPWPENEPVRVDHWNALLRTTVGGRASVVELNAKTCPSGQYTSTVDGVYIRSDGVHFSAAGARWLAPWLLPQLRALAG
jgi:lysophospholipase L1-like esterase